MHSFLDNDLYKFTMQQAICQHFSRTMVSYTFTSRDNLDFPDTDQYLKALRSDIENVCMLRLSDEYREWMDDTLGFLSPVYLDFLQGFRMNPDEVKVSIVDKKLHVTVTGYWYRTVLWEVPLLAIISFSYYRQLKIDPLSAEKLHEINVEKANKIKIHGLKVADFGTRRRYSWVNHNRVIEDMRESLIGTSNVEMAIRYNIKPIGTHAHEWFMAMGAMFGYRSANELGLKYWVETYQGNLGIALPDTYTSDVFFQNFDMMNSKLFDGVRWDSGEAYYFLDQVCNHYNNMGIPLAGKTIVFSDNLNIEKAIDIDAMCKTKGINASFGIGTHLTNDVGVDPLNIVMKLTSVLVNGKWVGTVKLSDNPMKVTGSIEDVKRCKDELGI